MLYLAIILLALNQKQNYQYSLAIENAYSLDYLYLPANASFFLMNSPNFILLVHFLVAMIYLA